MAIAGRLLAMIRSGNLGDTRVEIYTSGSAGSQWRMIGNDDPIALGGSGNDLIYTTPTDLEWEAPSDQGAPYSVAGIRMWDLEDLNKPTVYPETFFEPIPVPTGSKIRFTQIVFSLLEEE